MLWLYINILDRPVQFCTTFNEQLLSLQNKNNNSTLAQHLLDNGHLLDTTDSIMQTLHVTNERRKFTIEQAAKEQRGSRGIAPHFLYPTQRWGEWSTPKPNRFTHVTDNTYPLYRRLGGPQDRSGLVRIISHTPTGIRSPDRPARSQSLYRLSYRCSN